MQQSHSQMACKVTSSVGEAWVVSNTEDNIDEKILSVTDAATLVEREENTNVGEAVRAWLSIHIIIPVILTWNILP